MGKRTRALEEAFLDGLRGGWSITSACLAVNIDRVTAFKWRNQSMESRREDGTYADDFCLRWEDAVDAGVDKLEDEAQRRGVHGVEKPVYQGGVLVGTITEYSDTLLQILMKGKRPDRYNVDRHEHTGKDGGKIIQSVQIEFVDHVEKR